MAKYVVKVPEVWAQYYKVEANSADEAIEKADNFFSPPEDVQILEGDNSFEFEAVLDRDQFVAFPFKE